MVERLNKLAAICTIITAGKDKGEDNVVKLSNSAGNIRRAIDKAGKRRRKWKMFIESEFLMGWLVDVWQIGKLGMIYSVRTNGVL